MNRFLKLWDSHFTPPPRSPTPGFEILSADAKLEALLSIFQEHSSLDTVESLLAGTRIAVKKKNVAAAKCQRNPCFQQKQSSIFAPFYPSWVHN